MECYFNFDDNCDVLIFGFLDIYWCVNVCIIYSYIVYI